LQSYFGSFEVLYNARATVWAAKSSYSATQLHVYDLKNIFFENMIDIDLCSYTNKLSSYEIKPEKSALNEIRIHDLSLAVVMFSIPV